MEDEASLEAAIETYKSQLTQVGMALLSANESDKEELEQLENDLNQLIQITEESLLTMKKSRLLAMLDSGALLIGKANNGVVNVTEPSSSAVIDMEKELAEFQNAVADTSANSVPGSRSSNIKSRLCISSAEEPEENCSVDDSDDEDEQVDDMCGSKCRAPYSHSWGEMSYHNAVVLCREQDNAEVRVLYCNPTHNSMRPCPYFLEGKCRFDDLHCRFSHGEVVQVESLQPYLDPDYSVVNVGSKCLAHDTSDDIWYRATVVDILSNGEYHVMFDSNHDERKLEAQEIFPMAMADDVTSEEEKTDSRLALSDPEDSENLPVFLWRPGQTTDALGSWERHTRGVASKIMARMGYIVGQGLGKNSEGRAEPVPIQLLPQGKSLDKIMELKALAGDRDLYDVMKKSTKKQVSVDNAAAEAYASRKSRPSPVFDFINVKLGDKKSDSSKGLTRQTGGNRSAIGVKHIAAHDLHNKSDKQVNVQLFKTHEEMRNAEREIQRIQTALERNAKQDQLVAKNLRLKLNSMQNYVQQLRTSESFIKQDQNARQARNALTKF